MQNSIAFVFTHGPHGSSAGREGLDALIAVSAVAEDLGIFFISDGVLLLLPYQQPAQILSRDFIVTFGVLSLYNVNKVYFCSNSATERGLNLKTRLVLDVKWLSVKNWNKYLSEYDIVLTF